MVFRRYKKKFVDYINKNNFDHSQEIIDPLEYHSSFVAFAEFFTVMDYEKLPIWMYISPYCVVVSAIGAITLTSISLIEYVRTFQLHLITECGTYFLLMNYKLVIVYSIITGKKHYHNLLQALRDDFQYICTRGKRYRDKFFENQRNAFKACIMVAIFTAYTGIGIAISSSIALFFGFSKKEEGGQRPLPFPFWIFGYNIYASPVYEILFAFSLLFTFFHTYAYIFMMESQVIWVLQITSKADIITWNLQDLLVDVSPAKNKEEAEYYTLLIKHKMKEIVSMHHAMFTLMEDYAAVFRKCLLNEKIIASPMICMTAFCFVEKYKIGEVQMILLLLCIAAIVLVSVPCYICTHLLEKVQSVSNSCWDMPFWNAGTVIKPYMVLIMQRSMRPLPITTPGFDDTSLETFANIITRAYSCFNMLRQTDL